MNRNRGTKRRKEVTEAGLAVCGPVNERGTEGETQP